MLRRITTFGVAALIGAVVLPETADAQIGRRLRDAAARTAERELTTKVTTVVGDATACALGNRECVEQARQNGEKVVIVDHDGNVITDESGNPVTDPDVAEATMEEPGEGRWVNYDYLRGERPIYNTRWNIEDTDNPPALEPNPAVRVGRIPSNVDFGTGNMQIVQLDGLNTAEFTSNTRFRIPLSEPLPEDFSLEFTIRIARPNSFVNVSFEPFGQDTRSINWRTYENHYLSIWRGGGIYLQTNRISGADQQRSIDQQLTAVKFQVDDGYAILYVDGERIAQVPNFKHPIGSTAIQFDVNANQDYNAHLRNIRIDYGVEDPVSVLEAEGVYVSRSIYFDFNSANLRPESTPELERIRSMLQQYGQAVVIEGHTDAIGSDDYNIQLSTQRAQAVRTYLVGKGIDGGLIQAVGKGETDPIADNDTDDGRQANRRVAVRPAA
jgi:OOP family OmpA-OmpF porin